MSHLNVSLCSFLWVKIWLFSMNFILKDCSQRLHLNSFLLSSWDRKTCRLIESFLVNVLSQFGHLIGSDLSKWAILVCLIKDFLSSNKLQIFTTNISFLLFFHSIYWLTSHFCYVKLILCIVERSWAMILCVNFVWQQISINSHSLANTIF